MTIKTSNWFIRISTLGLKPNTPMPGTVGSVVVMAYLLGFCVLNLIPSLDKLGLQHFYINSFGILVPIIATLFALAVIDQALRYFDQKDPRQICLDEVVGMLVTFCYIPINFTSVIVGFILFRYFDIYKPWGIKNIEQLPRAWGVVLDDVLAGVYANLVLRLILLCLGWLASYFGLIINFFA